MTHSPIQVDQARLEGAVPLFLVRPGEALPEGSEELARLLRFDGELDQVAVFPDGVLIGAGEEGEPLALGAASMRLPGGDYRIERLPENFTEENAARGFALGAYRFGRYKNPGEIPVLLVEDERLAEEIGREAASIAFGRDLINTPAEEMGPDALEEEARQLAKSHGAEITVHKGDGFEKEFPLVHAVGRAAAIPPRLIELRWKGGSEKTLALIGKGVCFDSGGLNIKGGKGMALMKKDMGGAATALALGRRIMEEGLPIDLRLLVPAVENAVSGNAFRPGDVFTSRDGQTVEISNTDAEGRLILADAIALAAEEEPDRILTLATLTGAARVALGPDLPPVYSTESRFQEAVCKAGRAIGDPLWPMPFWERYTTYLRSDIADVNHAASTPFAGSITAALFLKRFTRELPYTHIDTYAWVPSSRPGRPKGGETLALRALLKALRDGA